MNADMDFMTPEFLSQLANFRGALFVYAVWPTFLLASVIFSIRLRFPQFRGVIGMRHALKNPESQLGLLLSGGAVALLSTATAVTIGGAGSLPWLLVFGFVLAPVHAAAARLPLLQTAQKGQPAGLFSTSRVGKIGAIAFLFLMAVVALGVGGAANADALRSAIPSAASSTPYGTAIACVVAAALTGFMGAERRAFWLSRAAAVALLTVFAIALAACVSHLSESLSTIARALEDMVSGSADAGAYIGAASGEIAACATIYLLSPFVANMPFLTAQAQSNDDTVSVAATLLQTALSLLIGVAFVATGAFSTPTSDSVSLSETRVFTKPFETASQLAEVLESNTCTGHVRIMDGVLQDVADPRFFGTTRSLIVEPRFEFRGKPADIALTTDHGRFTELFLHEKGQELPESIRGKAPAGKPPVIFGNRLVPTDLKEIANIRVVGKMAPRGAALFAATWARMPGGKSAWSAAFSLALWLLVTLSLSIFGTRLAEAGALVLGRAGRALFIAPFVGFAWRAAGGASIADFGWIAAGCAGLMSVCVLLIRQRSVTYSA